MSMAEDTRTTERSAGAPVLRRCDEAGVAWLTLNRPAQRNALSLDLMAALQAQPGLASTLTTAVPPVREIDAPGAESL